MTRPISKHHQPPSFDDSRSPDFGVFGFDCFSGFPNPYFVRGKMTTQWERLQWVIDRAGMNVNAFAHYIGLRRGENLYQIKRGNNRLSENIAHRIHAKFPQYGIAWLMFGYEGLEGSFTDTDVVWLPFYSEVPVASFPPTVPSNGMLQISSWVAHDAQMAVRFTDAPLSAGAPLLYLLRASDLASDLSSCPVFLLIMSGKQLFCHIEAHSESELTVHTLEFPARKRTIPRREVVSVWKICATIGYTDIKEGTGAPGAAKP